MIHETIGKIQQRVQETRALRDENKAELLDLLDLLKAEIASLSRTHADDAQSIAGFTQVSTHEATRAERNPQLVEHSLGGLRASVAGFEKSHPRLVAAVNRVCTALANLGI